MKIVVDAMGGDHGLDPTVEGAVQASREPGVRVILVGDQDQIRDRLDRLSGKKSTLEVC
ncbi:MAG: phosphate--acyl-ACP acyltransferase, partial [Nitrospirota bacterium]